MGLARFARLAGLCFAGSRPHPVYDTATHLHAAAGWMMRAQDAHGDGGCAKSFNALTDTWEPSYPETTGYIIGTFLDLARDFQDDRYAERAIRMGEWLLSLQLESGAFPALDRRTPVVFDTGQILHGLVDLAENSQASRYQTGIERAAAWLTGIQDTSGAWTKGAYLDTAHVYSTRVAWALFRAGQLLNESRFEQAALRNFEWALTQQQPNGWFSRNSLSDQNRPILHTIVYAARGFFEIGQLLDHDGYRAAAKRPMDVLLEKWQMDQRLYGAYDAAWKGAARARCLVGEAQLAGLWFRMAGVWNDRPYVEAAMALNRRLKQTQNLASDHPGIRGGIAGSSPVYGTYCFLKYPNWACKFFMDTLLQEWRLETKVKEMKP